MSKTSQQILALGMKPGWHHQQLSAAAAARGVGLASSTYESLTCHVDQTKRTKISCSAGSLSDFDVVMARTMPAGSLEQITFRLATMHRAVNCVPIVNSPASLELAIDKFATLSIVQSLGYPVPETVVTQDRKTALEAFDSLGQDCIVKPIFGGEGFGVMRIQHRELAKTTFAALVQQNAVIYLQRFVPPGGSDLRLLRIGAGKEGTGDDCRMGTLARPSILGQECPSYDSDFQHVPRENVGTEDGASLDPSTDHVIAIRRTNQTDFRTNVAYGGKSERVPTHDWHVQLADEVCQRLGLVIASVDLIDDSTSRDHDLGFRVVEVNGIPGWKSAQSVCKENLAQRMIDCLLEASA